MRHVLLLPVGSAAAREHYETSVSNSSELDRFNRLIDREGLDKLYYGEGKKIAVWGIGTSTRMCHIYETIEPNDLVLFVSHGEVISYAMVLMKIKSPALSGELWANGVWSNILFLTEPRDNEDNEIRMMDVIRILDYQTNFVLRGAICLDQEKSRRILEFHPVLTRHLDQWGTEARQERRTDAGERGDEEVFNPMIFISYCHVDEEYKILLKKHLAALLLCHKAGEIWDDRNLRAGINYNRQINEKIENANICILLISADYFASDYCMKEFEKIKQDDSKILLPVIVRDCYWKGVFSEEDFLNITFPQNNGNIFASRDRDGEFAKIVEYIDDEIRGKSRESQA